MMIMNKIRRDIENFAKRNKEGFATGLIIGLIMAYVSLGNEPPSTLNFQTYIMLGWLGAATGALIDAIIYPRK